MIYRSISLLFLLVWILTPILLTAQNQNSVQGDHKALMDIYNALDGDNWHNNNGWGGSPSSMGNWFGVTTNSSGRVTHLDLQTGAPFSNDVSDNRVYKKGNNLSNADRNGDLIPGREFPESIGNLKELRYLNVKNNTIRGPIPQNITQLVNAERILLEGHWREPDPGEGSREVPYNHPHSSSNGKTSTGTNFWTGSIPEDVGNLKKLVVWESSQTGLSGTIPKQFGQLQNLEMLLLMGIYRNEDTSIMLSGEIPPELGNASSLRYFFADVQNLSGSIPKELGQLSDLKHLRLNRNNLSGDIPRELGDIRDLRHIAATWNELTGPFPAFFWENGNNPSMNTFDFSHNNLSGELPSSITVPGHLNVFGFINNDLSGPLPNWITTRRLIQLNLSGNDFSGDLPRGFHDSDSNIYNRIRNLRLDNNNFTGPLPKADLGNSAYRIYLHNNDFTGTLPSEWAEINTSRRLDIRVHSNKLSGYVDPDIARIRNLSMLRIFGNRFSDGDLRDLHRALSSSSKMGVLRSDEGDEDSDSTYVEDKADLNDDSDFSIDGSDSVGGEQSETALAQNYPNPFNPSTQIQFSVSEPQQVSLKVYDMAGRQVATLFEGMAQSGTHQATFHAGNLASGIYFYRLVTGNQTINGRMTLLK